MTPLDRRLAGRIARDGPLTVADYMDAALTDPDHGYYTTRDPFGAGGDFTTAPEISQTFGELLGLWALAWWQARGTPRGALLAELGPGRGTLMADAQRAIRQACGGSPFRIHLVEASPVLAALQRERLAGADVAWHARLGDLPGDGPLFLLANEFLDALPVRQLVATDEGWRERRLDWRDDRYEPVLAAPDDETAALARALPGDVPRGRVAEVAPAREALVRAIARRIAAQGGAALLVDFTEPRLPVADTLQAVRAHRTADRFAAAGSADLAAAVDFAPLVAAAREEGAQVPEAVGQGAFLLALGLDHRVAVLTRDADAERARAVVAERERLVAPHAMGEDFRVMAILPPGAPSVEGFAPAP